MDLAEGNRGRESATRLANALSEWVIAIGQDGIVQQADLLQACATATFATTQTVFAILKPANADEVAQCVVIASRNAIPIYPVSRGRNWGLGSRVPTRDSVVMDLSRLSSIVAHDKTFGSIRLGPGVTFQDAYTFLEESGSPWFLPMIGGPTDASVVANFLERGDGSGPAAGRLANIISLQVVLASGDRIETGYGRFGEATPLDSLSSEPAGPALSGIFTQSNLGIVTEATLLLARKPNHLQICTVQVPQSTLPALMDALQPLALDLEACSEISVWNAHKIKARERSAEIENDVWFCTIALYAPTALMAQAQRELLLNGLKGVEGKISIFDQETLPEFEKKTGIFVGVPSDRNITSLYTGKSSVPPGRLDPERDRCGALWLCPELPLQGDAIGRVVALCQRTLEEFGYAPILGMSVSRGRTMRLFVSIFYDRDTPGEDARAIECHDTLQSLLNAEGCLPFRLGLASMEAFTGMATPTQVFIEALNLALDPQGILAPGRYSSPKR